MSRALHRRIQKLEASTHSVDWEAWIDRCLQDSSFLASEIKASPARPGSKEAKIDAELLELTSVAL
jgi:hypothetical protein